MSEPIITINGHTLTEGQAMTLRVAVEVFIADLTENGLGDDLHGQRMQEAYLSNLAYIQSYLFNRSYGGPPVKDGELSFHIKAPEGCTFRECDLCKSPYCFDGRLTNCLWCEINKEEKDDNI